ncbi:zinc-binding dehydrogenase [Brevibacterium sp. UMB10442]|nr:zinc-binding dehydrogenase [Brevibacterium sp. UMB10442]
MQGYLDDVGAGRAPVPIDRVYTFDQIRDAHTRMKSGNATGKLVVVKSEPEHKCSFLS